MKKIGISILNYNSFMETDYCINMIMNFNDCNIEIVVIDNNSTDNSFEVLSRKYLHIKNVTVLNSGKNYGYAYGNNIGIQFLINNKCDICCIMNNDLEISKESFYELLEYIKRDKNESIIGPILVNKNSKKIQSTGGKINLYTGKNELLNYGKEFNQCKLNYESNKIDFLSGALLIFKSKVYEKIGPIPEIYFLYFEETEWCLRAKKNKGIHLVCVRSSFAIHKGSESTSQINGLQEYFMARNEIVFENRNANFIELICFYFLLPLKILYRLRYGIHSLKDIKSYLDGLTGKNKYNFIMK